MQEARAMTLIEHLTLVEETRSEINRKHNLVDVMFLVISAIMSGAEGWNDIETYGDSKIDWLRQHRPFANGIPRRHTVARILRCIVIDTLLEALLCWVNEQRTHQGKPIIAFDGKVLRGSFRGNAKDALQLVTASGLTHQCLYFEQPHTFEQILFIQTAEPALVGHA